MANEEEKSSVVSFGKLQLTFLMVLLLSLFIISMQSSVKIRESNERKLEQRLATKLDKIISHCFLHNYIRSSFKEIIKELKTNGPESMELINKVKESESKYKISLKAFFYKNNVLKQSVNANEEDINLLADLLRLMCLNRSDEEFRKASNKIWNKLIKYFGTGSRLELLKLHKSFYTKTAVKDRKQHFHWDIYDNGFGIFLFTTKVPDLPEIFKVVMNDKEDKKYGLIMDNNKEIIPPEGITKDQTLVAYVKSTKSNKPFIVSNNYYWYFQTNRFDEKFCYAIPINESNIDYDFAGLLIYISAILFIITLFFYITSLIKCYPGKNIVEFLDNLSIRNRIIAIFTMSSIFPVLMTAIIGNSVISDKQSVIEKNILSESLDIIYNNMEYQREVLLSKTQEFADKIREEVKEAYLNNKTIDEKFFDYYLSKYSISKDLTRIDIRDSDIKTFFTLDDKETSGPANIFDIICRIVLKLYNPERINNKNVRVSPGEIVSESILSIDEMGFANIIRQRKKLLLFKVGAFPTTWYWDIYPELTSGPAFICVTTQMITTFYEHIKKYILSLPKRNDNIQLAVFVNNPHYVATLITSHKNLPTEDILDIANATFDSNKVLFREINIEGKPYWITSKHEKQVNSLVFINLISQKERLAVLEPFKWQIIIIGVFALVISLFGAWFITNLVILPVGDLSQGILAIRQRNKDFSIPVRREDEFGKLATAFNKVISEFDDLEYGKIIQESLLPPGAPVVQGYDIAFFTVSATDLAGDYHDTVTLDDGRICILLGDVSGHGISASLAMAMAKATFNYAKSKKVKFPEELMDMLNIMFNKELKPRNKLMTLISMVLTPETGEIVFDNAGQSFPAYYTSANQNCEEIKMPSLPLGGMKKRKKKPITKIMESGDAFIFYTDGIIEASNEKGEMFGYERFFATFTEQMKLGTSSKEAINYIYQSVEDFREPGPHSDDITMVIVKKL